MAAAAPIILAAGKSAAHTVSEALTADLAVVRFQGKKRKGKPIEYELHLNPAAFGVAAVGAGLALWLMQLNVRVYAGEYGKYVWLDGKTAREGFKDQLGDAPIRTRPDAPEQPYPASNSQQDMDIWKIQMIAWHQEWDETAQYVKIDDRQRAGIGQRPGFGVFGQGGLAVGDMSTYDVLFQPMGLAQFLGLFPRH